MRKLSLLVMLLCIVAASQAQNRVVNAQKIAVDNDDLTSTFFDYSVFQIDAPEQMRSAMVPTETNQLRLQLGDEFDWTMELTLADLFAEDFKFTVLTEGGPVVTPFDTDIAYEGVLADRPGSMVAMTITEDWVTGFVQDGDARIYIEPLSNLLPGMPWTDPDNPVIILPAGLFITKLTDNGNPGIHNDLMGVALYDPAGGLVFSSNWDGLMTIQQVIDGGNIHIHDPGPPHRENQPDVKDQRVNGLTDIISEAYPNPFQGRTDIGFRLPENGRTIIEVIAVSGEVVVSEDLGVLDSGPWHTWQFDADTRLAGGAYIYRVISGNHISTGNLILLK